MPLTAIYQNRKVVSLAFSHQEWSDLTHLHREGEAPLFMPCCNKPGHMRVSSRGLQHFIHAIDCNSWEPESIEHLEAKALIYSIFREIGWKNVQTEVQGIDWRADVLGKKGHRRVAFEIQLSPITKAELHKRITRYSMERIENHWLFKKDFPIKREKIIHLIDRSCFASLNGVKLHSRWVDSIMTEFNENMNFDKRTLAGYNKTMQEKSDFKVHEKIKAFNIKHPEKTKIWIMKDHSWLLQDLGPWPCHYPDLTSSTRKAT